MQRVLFQQTEIVQIHSQATRVLPAHGKVVQEHAVNDDVYDNGESPVRMVFAVLGNVIGGTLLLSGMFVLPNQSANFYLQCLQMG